MTALHERKSLKMQSKNWGVLSLNFQRVDWDFSLCLSSSLSTIDCSFRALLILGSFVDDCREAQNCIQEIKVVSRNRILILHICVHIGVYLLL